MDKQRDIEIKVGIFVSVGVALVAAAILVLGSTENLMSHKNHYAMHFPDVEGLLPGAKVVIQGIQVGTVDEVDFDLQKRDVRVSIDVASNATPWIRKDSMGEIATQGVLGDKYVSITAGTLEQPQLANNSEIQAHLGKNLTEFISKGDQLMISLNDIARSLDHLLKTFEAGNRSEVLFQSMATTAKNLASASEKLNREMDSAHLAGTLRNLEKITEKVNNGTGTIGALINDPGLYDDAKALLGGANRNRVIRNLVRQTIRKSEEEEAAATATASPTPSPK